MKYIIQFSVREICHKCDLPESEVRRFIEEEWIVPSDPEELLFDEEDRARLELIRELRQDLGVNDEAVPIILRLLDQLHLLRLRISQIK
jgi:chaperone modulatory protein CbpM